MLDRSIRIAFLLAAVLWAGLLFYLSSQPSIDAPALFAWQDKLFHLVVFGVLGFFVMGSLQATGTGYQSKQLWLVALLVSLYGVSDEIHQYFVPGRTMDAYDVLADALGALLGAWVMYLMSNLMRKQHKI